MTEPTDGLLVVLAGPSGVGKSSLARLAAAQIPGARLSVSVTTRAPRPDEVDGVHYRFVDDLTFDTMIEDDALLEWAAVHSHRSGTPADAVEAALAEGHVVLLEIDVQGAAKARARIPEALLIFVAPPSREELVRRLVARGTESKAELAVRHADAEAELAAATDFDHVVVNDDLDRAVDEVLAVVAAARSQPHG